MSRLRTCLPRWYVDAVTVESLYLVVVEAYGYDPFGRRAYTATATSSGSITNWNTYVGMHCVADLDADGTVLRSYTILLRQGYVGQDGPGVDNLLAITDHTAATPTVLFALTDHLGTVHALADASGTIVESYSYDAWGNVLAIYDSAGLEIPNQKSQISYRYMFQCREYSWATRLYNFRARWYDPETGRWLSNDPIGISGGLNQYVFCGNDPVNYRDPEGMDIDNRKGTENVYYKDENTGKVWNVPPGTRYRGKHDGVIEPSTGDVFKTPGKGPYQDGVWIDKDGNLHDVTKKFGGGKKDRKWLEDLQKRGDHGWDELFKYSDLIKKRKKCE